MYKQSYNSKIPRIRLFAQNNEMITYVVDNYNYSKYKHKFCENVSIPTKYIDTVPKGDMP